MDDTTARHYSNANSRWLIFRWLGRRHPFLVLLLLLAFLAAAGAVYTFAKQAFRHSLVLLTGPEGTNAEEIGNILRIKFADAPIWQFWGRSFELTPQETQGAQDNRHRIDEDLKGVLLGIALDGFDNADNVRRILDLGELPLVVVARREFLRKVMRTLPNTKEAPSFHEIAEFAHAHPSECKFYAGPAKSGTREVATKVLEHNGLAVEDVVTLGDLNFVEAAYALRTEALDVGFFMTTIDSSFVHDLLRHGDAALVGIHDTSGLAQSSQFLFQTTYEPGVVVDDAPPARVETVAANSILICSATMPENDVYWLTQSVTGYLAEESLIAEPDKSGKPAEPNDKADAEKKKHLRHYAYHPGAKAFHDHRQPWYVIATESSVYWVWTALILGPLAVFVGNLLTKKSARDESSSTGRTTAESVADRSALTDSITALREELHQASSLEVLEFLRLNECRKQLYEEVKNAETRSSRHISDLDKATLDEAEHELRAYVVVKEKPRRRHHENS